MQNLCIFKYSTQICSLISTVAEVLSWVHYLPHPEAGKQFKSQNILLSMFTFFFSFLLFLSLLSCATLTANLWFYRRAQFSRSFSHSAFWCLKKIQIQPELPSRLRAMQVRSQPPGCSDTSTEYLRGSVSAHRLKAADLCAQSSKKENKIFAQRTSSLFWCQGMWHEIADWEVALDAHLSPSTHIIWAESSVLWFTYQQSCEQPLKQKKPLKPL